MIVGALRENASGERRVALAPEHVPLLSRLGAKILIERNAGDGAGFRDSDYEQSGARITADAEEIVGAADLLCAVDAGGRSCSLEARANLSVVGFFDPLGQLGRIPQIAASGLTSLAVELIPRTSRAQRMDALSSMATIAGYKAVVLAASRLARIFPMLMTAAGAVKPARVLVLGAGVAGLQAIATARRLGASVSAYDVRPAAREQIESVGARSLDLSAGDDDAEDEGGYARAQSEDVLARQREAIAAWAAESDVVITTAAIPGREAPKLVSREAVEAMKPGSVIVDLAARTGGNCDVTECGADVVVDGVSVLGPRDLAATLPDHASRLYGKNLCALIEHLAADGKLALDREDDIVAGALLTCDGEIVNERISKQIAAEGAH